MARSADPLSYAMVVALRLLPGNIVWSPGGPTIRAMREIEDALRIAERSGDDLAVSNARVTLGVALVHRQTAAERDRGQKLLAEVSEVFLAPGTQPGRVTDRSNVYSARERARRGESP